jgi:hypothetical protein
MISKAIVAAAGMEKQARGPYYPRPSSAGPERCIRQLAYYALGFPVDREFGDRFILTMDDSSWHEELTADWIRKAHNISGNLYKLHSIQMGVEPFKLLFLPDDGQMWHCKICKRDIPKNMLHGHIDGILTETVNDVKGLFEVDYLWEHKALNHFTFQRYWKNETLPMDYLTQCCLYLRGLQTYLPNLKRGILAIKNKNTAQYMDFLIEYDRDTDTCYILEIELSGDDEIKHPETVLEEICTIAYQRFETIHEIEIQDRRHGITLPDRPYGPDTEFPCGYCSWYWTCWEGFEGEFKDDTAILPEEYYGKGNRYLDINALMLTLKKEKEAIREEFIKYLCDEKILAGVIQDIGVTLTIKTKGEVSPDGPKTEDNRSVGVTLSIKKIKPKKEKKKKKEE